ncbi:MAG TPA: hypothetical protein VE870_08190 [Bacteroidales bacterium]|nr:hypothetical protein [Bacteroidales bacterium]
MVHKDASAGTGSRISWTAPSNIALVKYWGKKEGQLPMNPSISMTLEKSVTKTTVHYSTHNKGRLKQTFFFEGKREPSFEDKLALYFDRIRPLMPVIDNLELQIDSQNSFPHSSGIASSASAMAALSLCLLSIEHELKEETLSEEDFKRQASRLARLGSGSASRSVYPGYVLWGKTGGYSHSSDEHALELEGVHPFFSGMNDSILIVNSGRKKVSSSAGHALMEQHPFAGSRYEQARENAKALLKVLVEGDSEKFIRIVENEALTLHAMMMSSDPGYLLLETGTLEIIGKVRDYREQSGQFIAFTLDAGPNIHLLYHDKDKHETELFIKRELMKFCENEVFITDRLGTGPSENQINNQ